MNVLSVIVAFGPSMTIADLANRISNMGGQVVHPITIRKALGPLTEHGYITIQPTKGATKYRVTECGIAAGRTWYQSISNMLDDPDA